MTSKTLATLFLVSFTLFSACKKDNDPPKDPENEPPQNRLQSINWSNGLTGNFVYDNNRLQHIDYTYKNVSSRTVYGWNGKSLTELYDDRSQFKNVFEYDNDGRVIKMSNIERYDIQSTKYYLAFHYSSANLVDTLLYFTVNEAGEKLRWVSGYEYNGAGDLAKVTTTYGSTLIIHTIDAYSPPVSFIPWLYIEPTLNENFVVYNLGIMTQFQKSNKLPAKVTRLVQTATDPLYVDKIAEDVFTVNNYKIEKVNTTITYPGMPDYVSTLEAVYSYF